MPAAQQQSELPAGTSRSRTYFPELESLRGLAIGIVFAFHVDGILHAGGVPSAPPGTWVPLPLAILYAGHTGVSLFFLLSGFLLGLPFLAAAGGGPRVATGGFFRRRALRVLPLYWLVVAIAAVLAALTTRTLWPLAAGGAYMLFLNSVVDLGASLWPFSVPLWSLATEVQFYLLLPILGLLSVTPRRRWMGPLLLLLWAVAYGAYVLDYIHAGSMAGQFRLRNSVLARSPLFVAGILAAALYLWRGAELRAWLARQPVAARGGADLLVVACFVGLSALLRWVAFAGWGADDHPSWRLGEAFCWMLVLLAVLLAPLRTRPLFVNPVFDLLGRLSYSIFLLHVPLLIIGIFLLRPHFPGALASWTLGGAALLLAISLAIVGCAAVTYRWVERPFLVRKARVEG